MCLDRVVGIDYLNIKGNGSSFRSKSHALEYVTRTTSSNPEVSLYVGDTPGDHIACLEVGLMFACIVWVSPMGDSKSIHSIDCPLP